MRDSREKKAGMRDPLSDRVLKVIYVQAFRIGILGVIRTLTQYKRFISLQDLLAASVWWYIDQ